MKKDKVYGTGLEVETFSKIYKIKIILFTRYITDKNCNKKHSDKINSIIIGNDYEGNFALMLDNYSKSDSLNHYSSLRPKSNKNSLNSNRLNEIKNDIINKYPNIEVNEIISGLTGKLIGERKGKSDWNVYEPLSRKNNEKGSFDYYTVNKINWNYNIKSKYVNYADLVECINLSEIIEEFNAENIKMNGVGKIIKNYKNILINKIKIKGKEKELKTEKFLKTLGLDENLAKEFTNCICYNCSGYNNKGKKLYKIVRSLYELKNHCRDLHNKEINNCIINYTLAENHIEIEHSNKLRYIINLDDMYKKDKDNILQQMRGGYNPINNYFNINKIKIIGENILTLSKENRALLSNVLDEYNPDFVLLNECKMNKKAKFNMSGYNLILSDNQEVGIIYKNIYYLNDCFKDIEDNYNIIRLVNTTKYKFIIYVTYLPPNEEHNNKISELIEKLLLIQRRYNNLKLILFGDLNINKDEIDIKLKNKIEKYGFKIWYNKNSYTRSQIVKNEEKKSYLDYFITYGINYGYFNIMDKLIISDHKAISFEFLEDNNFKLDRIKEIIEPYAIAQIKTDDISNKLKNAFLNDITEVKIKRIINDNKYEFKPKNIKIKFKTKLKK